jgi:hypothetical protein
MVDDNLMSRALAAYWRSCTGSPAASQPNAGDSAIEEHGGKRFVVLRSDRGVLAVYRVRNDGMLKGLRRWPHTIGA